MRVFAAEGIPSGGADVTSPGVAATPHVADVASANAGLARAQALMNAKMPQGPFHGATGADGDRCVCVCWLGHRGENETPAMSPSYSLLWVYSAWGCSFGVIRSGFDVCMPPLVALLVARYDAWLAAGGGVNADDASVLEAVNPLEPLAEGKRDYSFLAHAVQSAYRMVYG
jgi:hypothetical protein